MPKLDYLKKKQDLKKQLDDAYLGMLIGALEGIGSGYLTLYFGLNFLEGMGLKNFAGTCLSGYFFFMIAASTFFTSYFEYGKTKKELEELISSKENGLESIATE